MTKIITRILFAVLVFAGVGVSVASAQSLNLSTDPSYAASYIHYCPPYTETFVQDGVYSPTDRSCVYSIPNDVRAIGSKAYMLFYKGTPGNATLLRSEPVVDGAQPATLVRVQSIGSFVSAFQPGDKFFGAVVPSGPIDPSNQYPELEQFNLAFTTGTTTPHNTYHLVGWELGEFDTLGPNVTITSPVEGATYQSTDSIPLLSDVTDPSGVQSVLYTINDTAVIQPNQPLPFNLVPLGSAYINAYAVDTLGNETLVTINFTIVPPVTDVCPNVPGIQASGPCADQECVNAGGTWDGDSCEFPATYTVEFLQPINNTGHQITANTSVFKAGSTVPIKFVIKDRNGNQVQVNGIIPWIAPVKGPALNAPVSEPVYTEQPTSGSQYDWSGGQYKYNWKTAKNGSGFWYYLYIVLPDGSVHSTIIGLR